MTPQKQRVVFWVFTIAMIYWGGVGLYYLFFSRMGIDNLAADKERFLERGAAVLYDFMVKRDFPRWPSRPDDTLNPPLKDRITKIPGVVVSVSIEQYGKDETFRPGVSAYNIRLQLQRMGSAFDISTDCAYFRFTAAFDRETPGYNRAFGNFGETACGSVKDRLILNGVEVLTNNPAQFDAAFQNVQYQNFFGHDLPQLRDVIAPTRYLTDRQGFHDPRLHNQ